MCIRDSAHTDHRTNGQVDVAGDQQIALANADDQVFGHRAQQVLDIDGGEYVLSLIHI